MKHRFMFTAVLAASKTRDILKIIIPATFFALIIVSPVMSQQSSKLQDIGELIRVSGVSKNLDAMIPVLIEQALNGKEFATLSPSGRTYLKRMLVDEAISSKADLYWRIASIYDRYFTHQEIIELTGFYKSRLGQKVARALPQVFLESTEAGRRWGEEIGARVTKQIMDAVQNGRN